MHGNYRLWFNFQEVYEKQNSFPDPILNEKVELTLNAKV